MTNKERSVRFFEVVWNDRNDDALSGFLHPDVVANLEGGVVCRGLNEFRAWRDEVLAALPDLRMEMLDAVAEDSKVVVRWRATATVGGEPLAVDGMTWHLHSSDKIVEGVDAWNKGALDARLAAG
jgi:predicted ester cyclase